MSIKNINSITKQLSSTSLNAPIKAKSTSSLGVINTGATGKLKNVDSSESITSSHNINIRHEPIIEVSNQ